MYFGEIGMRSTCWQKLVIAQKYSAEVPPNFSTHSAPSAKTSAEHYKGMFGAPLLQIHISNASSRRISSFGRVHNLLPYNATLQTNDFTIHFFKWRLRDPRMRSPFLLKASFPKAIRLLISWQLLQSGHQTSEVTKLFHSFQILSIDCDLHSSSFYRRHSHDFSLLRIDSDIVLLWCSLQCIHNNL